MEIEAPTRDGIRPSCRGLAKGTTMSPDDYMKEMANSKICLAPRGTSFETFRHYEAASVGCVVVSYRLPPTWFNRNFLRRGSIGIFPSSSSRTGISIHEITMRYGSFHKRPGQELAATGAPQGKSSGPEAKPYGLVDCGYCCRLSFHGEVVRIALRSDVSLLIGLRIMDLEDQSTRIVRPIRTLCPEKPRNLILHSFLVS